MDKLLYFIFKKLQNKQKKFSGIKSKLLGKIMFFRKLKGNTFLKFEEYSPSLKKNSTFNRFKIMQFHNCSRQDSSIIKPKTL